MRGILSLCCGALLVAAGCSSSKPATRHPGGGDAGGNGGDASGPTPPAPYDTLHFDVSDIEVDSVKKAPGFQGKLLRADDGTLDYAYFKGTDLQSVGTKYSGNPNTCNIAVFGGDAAPGVDFELWLATLPAGSTSWSTQKLPLSQLNTSIPYATALYGLDAAFDASGQLTIAFAGSGTAGLFTCGSGDLALATQQGATTWNIRTVDTDSSACCTVCSPSAPDLSCCADPACTSGTDVGPWASIVQQPGAGLAVSFMDYHNTITQDGQKHRGLDLWQQSGVTGIRPWSGKGAYSDMVYVNGTGYTGLMVAYTNRLDGDGLYVARRTNPTATDFTDWEETPLLHGQQITPQGSQQPGYVIGERISMAVAPDGTVGLAANIVSDDTGAQVNDLYYFASHDDGATWEPPEDVDQPLINLGANPSLAFDSQSRPVIAYRVCGATTTCGAQSDGIRYAWRDDNGRWWTFNVHFDATSSSYYPQLVLDPTTDEPTIVFQDIANGGSLDRGAIMVAQGHFGT